jgi:dolichol-phosphate mannosyltransferase
VLAAVVALNEAERIGAVLDRFQRSDVEAILVVDDGSSDGTAQEAARRDVHVRSHTRRRGVGAAIRTAIEFGRAEGFDVLVVVAGNDKDRPREIPRLLQPIREGHDFVQGSRYLPGGQFGEMPWHRRFATRLHPLLFSVAVRRRLTDSTNGFRAFRLSLLDDPRLNIDQHWLDAYELEPYLLYKAIRLGYTFTEVPVTKIYPPSGSYYTRMTPVTGWWSILRPVFLLALGLRR